MSLEDRTAGERVSPDSVRLTGLSYKGRTADLARSACVSGCAGISPEDFDYRDESVLIDLEREGLLDPQLSSGTWHMCRNTGEA